MDDNADYFIKIIQPRLNKLKVQDPFHDFKNKTLMYYNKNVWQAMQLPVNNDESQRVARSRAFSNAKQKIYFNKDLTEFVTLTYHDNMQNYDVLLQDMKIFLKSERRSGSNPKYLWVVEKQKRGALHVHMICNDFLTKKRNKNGYYDAIKWPHGWSSIKTIKGTDVNFKPYLYLFKYMNKSQKIGGRYVHSSRNLNNYTVLTDFDFNKKLKKQVYKEISQLGTLDSHIVKEYYANIN